MPPLTFLLCGLQAIRHLIAKSKLADTSVCRLCKVSYVFFDPCVATLGRSRGGGSGIDDAEVALVKVTWYLLQLTSMH